MINIKFDWMEFVGFKGNRMYFRSQTNIKRYYYFEFSLRYLLTIFNNKVTKYLGIPRH